MKMNRAARILAGIGSRAGMILVCAAFYAAMAYLVPRDFSALRVITEESAPHFLRLFITLFCAIFGWVSYRSTRDIWIPQAVHLGICFWFRYYCYITPHIDEEEELLTRTEQNLARIAQEAEEIEPLTATGWITLAMSALFPVLFSFLVGYCCRAYRERSREAGMDRFPFDGK